MLLSVDPWYQRDPRLGAPISEIRSILAGDKNIVSVPFDTVYSAAGEFIARQLKGNDPGHHGLIWRIQGDMSCDIVFPLPFYIPGVPEDLIIEFDGYHHAKRFIAILKEQGHTQPRIVDLNFLLRLLIGIASQYRRLLQLADVEGKFYFKVRVLNAWRVVPFVDVKIVLDEFKAHGLPMMMDRTVTVPIGDDPDSFVPILERVTKGSEDTEQTVSVSQCIEMFMMIALAFGVPIGIEGNPEATTSLYSELLAAGKRALTVQENRNKRRAGV